MCCCLLFCDLEGKQRLVRHACCPTHWRAAESAVSSSRPDQAKAAHP